MKHLMLAIALVASPALAQENRAQESGLADLVVLAPEVTLQEATRIQSDDHIIGAEDAPHEMVVYASVTCGHCGAWFNNEWAKVKSDLVEAGLLRVAVREIPTPPAQASVAGFMIANCADEAEWFPNIERQFARQEGILKALREGRGNEIYLALAKTAGIETEEDFQACLQSDADYAPIDRSMQRHDKTGVRGVPAFFINGKELKGAHDADDIIAKVRSQD